MAKPHLEFGQRGKGKGQKKKRKGGAVKPYRPPAPAVPTQPPNVGEFPKNPPAPPSFLPNTPGFERSQRNLSDQLAGAETNYNIGNNMITAGVGLSTARLGTDKGYDTQRLNEAMVERGLYDSGIRPQLQTRDITIPYGRREQDIGIKAGGQYADLANQFGQANLGYDQGLVDALLQRASDAYQAMPLGLPIGGYEVPDMPLFNPSYPPRGRPSGGGKKRRKRKKR